MFTIYHKDATDLYRFQPNLKSFIDTLVETT